MCRLIQVKWGDSSVTYRSDTCGGFSLIYIDLDHMGPLSENIYIIIIIISALVESEICPRNTCQSV